MLIYLDLGGHGRFGLRFAINADVKSSMAQRFMTGMDDMRGGEEMSLAYDLFERLPDGEPMWVKAVASIDDARMLIGDLVAARGRAAKDFFVYDLKRGSVVAVPEA